MNSQRTHQGRARRNHTPQHAAGRGPMALAGVVASVVAGLAITSTGHAQAAMTDAVGTFGLRANGGALHTVQSQAQPGADANSVRFVGSAVDPNGAWEATWDYSADLNPNGNAKLNGVAVIVNKSAAATDFEMEFEVPICPFIQSGSKMGGSCVIKLTTNANGGAISTQGGSSVFSALADGGSGSKLFHGPFNMGSTGSGTAQTANLFGAPFPGAAAPAVTNDFGVRHVFKLTDGDTVALTSNLVVGGDPANFVACTEASAPQTQASTAAVTPTSGGSATIASSGAPSTSTVMLGGGPSDKVIISADKPKRKAASANKSKSRQKASTNSNSNSNRRESRTSRNRNR